MHTSNKIIPVIFQVVRLDHCDRSPINITSSDHPILLLVFYLESTISCSNLRYLSTSSFLFYIYNIFLVTCSKLIPSSTIFWFFHLLLTVNCETFRSLNNISWLRSPAIKAWEAVFKNGKLQTLDQCISATYFLFVPSFVLLILASILLVFVDTFFDVQLNLKKVLLISASIVLVFVDTCFGGRLNFTRPKFPIRLPLFLCSGISAWYTRNFLVCCNVCNSDCLEMVCLPYDMNNKFLVVVLSRH